MDYKDCAANFLDIIVLSSIYVVLFYYFYIAHAKPSDGRG